jgi:hypothetical protein
VEEPVGFSSIVSIKCDYPDCETSDEYMDSDRVEHQHLPEGWVRLEYQTDVEHEDHHDPVGLFALLCPEHGLRLRDQIWPGRTPEAGHSH